MPDPITPSRRFLSAPTRGGKLAILNCLLWALWLYLYLTYRNSDLELPVLFLAMLLSVPALPCIAYTAMIPSLGPPDYSYQVASCVLVGVNALLWGYGLSWLISRYALRREQRRMVLRLQRRCERCGYDVRATPDRCPECGTPVVPL